MKIIAATNNYKKLEEFRRILKPELKVASLKEQGISIEIEETGETFEENAYIKARTIYELTKMPVLADDSGLVVDYLGGKPGVFSARYAGEHATDKENNEKLLKEMQNVPLGQRMAAFVCVICYIDQEGQDHYAKGYCSGVIGASCIGENGFGYDPLFMVGEKSFAQLTNQQKDAISHRGKALKELEMLLK